MADALDLGSSAARRGGSSPPSRNSTKLSVFRIAAVWQPTRPGPVADEAGPGPIAFCANVVRVIVLVLVGLWLLTHEYWLSAVVTIIFAKFLGVGVTAFIFDVTRSKLLEMPWFERLYEFIMGLRAKAATLVEPVKQRILEMLRGDGGGWSSRVLRLIQRFRKSVHEAR